MRSQALRARPRRRGLPKDEGARLAAVIAPNLLDRQFTAERANQKWIADFTYVWTAEGWLYVAAVIDLFSRRVVGWSMKAEMTAGLVKMREEMDVGLSPLREAVTRLVSDGLVDVAPQRGYTVAPISVANLDEVCALRIELEPYALRRSIANGDLDWETGVMGALYRLNKTDRIAGDAASLEEWESANNAFHLALIQRCDMPLLLKIYHSLVSMNGRYRHIYLKAVAIQRDVIDEHTAIAEAAVERKADQAGALLMTHIERSAQNLRRLIVADLPTEAD